MGRMLIQIKLMPTSPNVNLEEIKQKSQEIIERSQGKISGFREEPIAFGLKALIASFSIDEKLEIDPIENQLGNLENISSAQIIDMRRAFG